MRRDEHGVAIPGPADPLPWQCDPERIGKWIPIADAEGVPLGYEGATAEFAVHAANYHARLADIVRRLDRWKKGDEYEFINAIGEDAQTLWAEMRKGARMKAEIVRADEIKAGDRIYDWQTATVQTVVTTHESAILRGWLIFRCDRPGPSYEHHPASLVCRILPEPVEVREFWLVTHLDIHGKAAKRFKTQQSARDFIRQHLEAKPHYNMRDIKMRHVREIVLSIEEVKNGG